MNPDLFPMRINKYLAFHGHATRRGADDLIASGKVRINDRIARIGDKVEAKDTVTVTTSKSSRSYAYYAYHKPRGVITHSPQGSEKDIEHVLPKDLQKLGLFPVGRLDKASHGLIILTNDGRVTDRLLSPTYSHDKEYHVTTKLPLRKSFKEHMEVGVNIEGYQTKPTSVRILGDRSFLITLTEGKKHQIRRMVVTLHNEVTDLKRVRILGIRLGTLGVGQARAIEGEELQRFLASLNLPVN